MENKRKKRLLWQLPFLAVLIIGSVLIVKRNHDMPYQVNSGFVFGTTYRISYQYDEDLNDEIVREMGKVDKALSTFNKQSIISQVNQGQDITVNDMFESVFNMAEEISDETDGSFDITVAPLVNAWGFGFKNGKMPDKATVDSLKAITGYKKVKMVNSRVVKDDPRIMLDCSAIAKGYGSDVVAAFLQRKGITNFMVEIGGEIVTRGINSSKKPWRIGVTKPVDDSLSTNEEIQTILNITDKAMATSGNYRNFYYKGGKKYAHTIDPKTGYPVQHNILSSTVIANDCATADAYATAFMVMGLDKAKKLLARHPELMAYFICANDDGTHSVWYSPELKSKITP